MTEVSETGTRNCKYQRTGTSFWYVCHGH